MIALNKNWTSPSRYIHKGVAYTHAEWAAAYPNDRLAAECDRYTVEHDDGIIRVSLELWGRGIVHVWGVAKYVTEDELKSAACAWLYAGVE